MSTYNMAGGGDAGIEKLSKNKTFPVLQQFTVANEEHVGNNM